MCTSAACDIGKVSIETKERFFELRLLGFAFLGVVVMDIESLAAFGSSNDVLDVLLPP